MASVDLSQPTSDGKGERFNYLAPWAPAPRPEPRQTQRPGDFLEATSDRVTLARATAEVRIALEQAAVAAEEAAAYARAVANVLTSLNDRAVPSPVTGAPC